MVPQRRFRNGVGVHRFGRDDAFRDVQAARADQERLQNEAQAYANRVVPEARGDAERILQAAQGYRDQVIAEAMLSMARHFDMLTVAENVETWEDAEFLIGAGYDMLQGHFFGAATVRPGWLKQVLATDV